MVCILFTAVSLLAGGMPAQAAGETGSLRIQCRSGETVVEEGSVTLYRVGVLTDSGYQLAESCGGGIVKLEDVRSPELALWLADTVADSGIPRLLDADGEAVYSGLEPGVYLVTQQEPVPGFVPFLPFLVTLPFDGQWEILANPKTGQIHTQSPRTGQHPAPILGAMGLVLSGLALMVCFDKIRRK